jgi:drug/metabolite transporter (DMT)-like permease
LKNKLLAHLAIIGANGIYGLNYVIAKGIMPDFMAPRAIIFLRASGTMVLFWAIASLLIKEKVDKRDLWRLALCAFFGVFLNQILFFEGLNMTTPINASIIITTVPVMVLIYAHFIIHEKITRSKLFGIILGGTGAGLVILSSGSISLSADTFLGNVLIFINAASFAFYLVMVKPLMVKYHPLTVIKWIFLFGFLFVAPFCYKLFIETDFSAIPVNIWGSIAYVIIATTAIAYYLNNYSLTVLSPSVTGAYIYLQPLLASTVAILLGTDHLTPEAVIASLLILTGVYFVSRPKKKTEKPAR